MKARILSLLTGDGMKARAMRGTMLSFIGFGSSQVIRLASNLILTRILFPEAFGLMALVQVVLTGLEMFSDVGMRPAIIQSDRGDDSEFLNTAWTVQILRGVLLWLVAWALAAPAANFYEQRELLYIIPVIGATTLIAGFGSTRLIQANRNLYLGPQIALGVSAQFLATVAMILMALWLKSVWALVFGALIGAGIKAVGSHFVIPGPRNRLAWDKEAIREMFHFGKYIFVATIAGYFVSQGDRMVLGKYVTLETLAVFTIAFFLANVPATLNQRIVGGVLLPLYRNRPPAGNASNRRQIGRARMLLVSGFLAIATVFALTGEPLIRVLYDARYHDAGPILVLLSLSIMPGLITAGYKQILLANGNSRDFTFFNVGSAGVRIALLVFMISNYGIIGAILAPYIVDVLTYPILVYYIRPYRGWYGLLDAGFFMVSLLVAVVAIWMSPAALDLLVQMLPG